MKKCVKCGEEVTEKERIYYDFPPGSENQFCQKCYDEYMISLAETGVIEWVG
jgi:hypothetical protein